jgi:hypothetical protein
VLKRFREKGYEADPWGRLLTCGGLANRLSSCAGNAAKRGPARCASRRRINNPPQIGNLPHKGFCATIPKTFKHRAWLKFRPTVNVPVIMVNSL